MEAVLRYCVLSFKRDVFIKLKRINMVSKLNTSFLFFRLCRKVYKIFLIQILFLGVAERAYAMWAWSAILTTPVVTGLGV